MSAEKNIMRSRGAFKAQREPKEYDEKVVEIARVSRVVKGGRRIRFRALVILGNRKGTIGMGIGKANEVADAVRKATTYAKKHLINVPIIEGTIPHEVIVKHGGARVMLKPASSGTSIVAGGSIRQVAELAGITDLLTKSLGSSNKVNIVTATLKALNSFIPEVTEKIKKIVESKLKIKTEVPAITVSKDVDKEAIKAEEKAEIKPEKIVKKQVKREPVKSRIIKAKGMK